MNLGPPLLVRGTINGPIPALASSGKAEWGLCFFSPRSLEGRSGRSTSLDGPRQSKTPTAWPDSVLVDRHIKCSASQARSQRSALLEAAAETSGKEALKAVCRVWRSSLQRGWSARIETSSPSHRPACSVWYRSLHVPSSAKDSFKKFLGARSHCPHYSHFSNGTQSRRSSFCSGRGENFSQTERRSADLQKVAWDFLNFAYGLSCNSKRTHCFFFVARNYARCNHHTNKLTRLPLFSYWLSCDLSKFIYDFNPVFSTLTDHS